MNVAVDAVFDEVMEADARVLLSQLQARLQLPVETDEQGDRRYELITEIQEWVVGRIGVSGRHSAYLVVLEHSAREDYAAGITRLLCLIKGVVSVVPVEDDYQQRIGIERVRRELAGKLYDLAREINE